MALSVLKWDMLHRHLLYLVCRYIVGELGGEKLLAKYLDGSKERNEVMSIFNQ